VKRKRIRRKTYHVLDKENIEFSIVSKLFIIQKSST